ncbi:Hypothetical predicted protein [Paramuricea clavata]|uniref:Uncharacterized protein n=1 Tax=Paramuricea clavata TaxID=317549 RepID=A0A6S7GV96_PARCT|nr:Hypothetical predicted protein [Paramuricea clavata]
MGRGFSFRLFYRVVFFCFCLIFACFYHGGGSEYDRREDKTEPNKLKDEFKEEATVNHIIDFLGTVMKTLGSERIQKSPKLPSPPKVKVPSKESTTISHSRETKWQNNDGKNISSLENQIFQQNDLRETAKRETFASLTTQHLRNTREIDAISESPTECSNFTFTIKYENNYRVWNNFSMTYQSRMYRYNEYRVTDDGLQVCDSSDTLTKQRWRDLIAREKKVLASKYCNVSVDGFYFEHYTLFKNFTVFFHPTEQNFTRRDYGVMFGHFAICSAKLSLSCNDDLVKVKYDEQYNVFKNFSLVYNNTMYNYREYRFRNNSLEMCASNDSRIRAIWKTRNSWEKLNDRYKCRESVSKLLDARTYTVTKQFTVYYAVMSQYFTRNEYGMYDGKPFTCEEKFKPKSTEYTQEDLSMCNDSIINIKYDDGYKVWTDFSIFYKNKVYDYTEYRVLNDSINICNSSDNYVRNIWKVRNKWVKAKMHDKSCNKPIDIRTIRQKTVRKDFSVLILRTDQVIAKYDYGVFEGKFIICKEKIKNFYRVKDYGAAEVAVLCALALSTICLLLLLIVYCMLPELRTLPGLNLMSFSFAFLLWQTYTAVFVSLYFRVGQAIKIPCDGRIEITLGFIFHSILMNAAANIYHLRKTFCGNTLVKCNTLVKSDENKWKTFLKYSLFSWGVPVIITIVGIVLVKKDVLKFQRDSTGCVKGNELSLWLTVMAQYGLPGCLVLYIIVMFSLTAYRIRQKLKAIRNIAQKSNIVKKRNSFVILLKLSTTTAISFFPVLFMDKLDGKIILPLFTVASLTGAYIGIAFVFTRKNYMLLKEKYFQAKKKPINA